MKKEQKADELRLALVSWRESLKRYDLAEPDEAGYAALETEAALRRTISPATSSEIELTTSVGAFCNAPE